MGGPDEDTSGSANSGAALRLQAQRSAMAVGEDDPCGRSATRRWLWLLGRNIGGPGRGRGLSEGILAGSRVCLPLRIRPFGRKRPSSSPTLPRTSHVSSAGRLPYRTTRLSLGSLGLVRSSGIRTTANTTMRLDVDGAVVFAPQRLGLGAASQSRTRLRFQRIHEPPARVLCGDIGGYGGSWNIPCRFRALCRLFHGAGMGAHFRAIRRGLARAGETGCTRER